MEIADFIDDVIEFFSGTYSDFIANTKSYWDSLNRKGKQLWEQVVVMFQGKTLIILGERGVGKTTLHTFIRTGELPDSHYKPTAYATRIESTRLALAGLDLKLSSTQDLPGGEDAISLWRGAFLKADIIIYVVHAEKLLNKNSDALKRIEDDSWGMREWIEKLKKERGNLEKSIAIVVNFVDKIPDYSRSNHCEYLNNLKKLKEVDNLYLRLGNPPIIFGALNNQQNAEALIFSIFNNLYNNNK